MPENKKLVQQSSALILFIIMIETLANPQHDEKKKCCEQSKSIFAGIPWETCHPRVDYPRDFHRRNIPGFIFIGDVLSWGIVYRDAFISGKVARVFES